MKEWEAQEVMSDKWRGGGGGGGGVMAGIAVSVGHPPPRN